VCHAVASYSFPRRVGRAVAAFRDVAARLTVRFVAAAWAAIVRDQHVT
jgi:hypothetical protein